MLPVTRLADTPTTRCRRPGRCAMKCAEVAVGLPLVSDSGACVMIRQCPLAFGDPGNRSCCRRFHGQVTIEVLNDGYGKERVTREEVIKIQFNGGCMLIWHAMPFDGSHH